MQSQDTINKNYTLKLPNGKHDDATHTITARYKIIHKPELHALVIGIDTYKNPKLGLKYAVNDATLFVETIKSQSKGIFSGV